MKKKYHRYYMVAWSHAWPLSMLATASHTNFIVCLILLAVAKAKAKNKNPKYSSFNYHGSSFFFSLYIVVIVYYIYIYIYLFIYSCRTVDNLLSCNQFSTLLWLTYWFPIIIRQRMGIIFGFQLSLGNVWDK